VTDGFTMLRLHGVSRAFPQPGGEVRALRGVSAEVRRGEFVALTGPSGSGKSTLLHLAALLDAPTQGRVELAGRDTSGLPEAERCEWRARQVGMVFQRFHLLPRRSALDNVRLRFRYLPVTRREAEARARAALERVGLADLAARPARVLSGGEMQRVAIARAIAQPPALLVADEPTGNLDLAAAERVIELFHGLLSEGIAVLMATHNPALLGRCHRRLRLEAGCLVEES
jgi:putative ABC transport system ATP-binding protein